MMLSDRLDGWIGDHRLFVIVALILLIAGPGYLRLESLVNESDKARVTQCREDNVLISQINDAMEQPVLKLKDCR